MPFTEHTFLSSDGLNLYYREYGTEHGGTQILRLAAGDGATFLSEPCTCGLTTPRLRGVQREIQRSPRRN